MFGLMPPRIRRVSRAILLRLGWEHKFLRLRRPGLRKLSGNGIEIGAFEHPAPVPASCRTSYVDALTPEEAAVLFPEIDSSALIRPDFVVDVNVDGLGVFEARQWDYVIACHVIEHLTNPGRFVGEMFRIVRPGGWVVIAAPDKRYTFDRARPETPVSALHRYFVEGRDVHAADYEDISRYVNVTDLTLSESDRQRRLESYRERREHLSVWTSESFREFWIEAMKWSRVSAVPVYEIGGERNHFEYFGVWQKK